MDPPFLLVLRSRRLIMKAHEFFESKSADFAPAQDREQHLSPEALGMSAG